MMSGTAAKLLAVVVGLAVQLTVSAVRPSERGDLLVETDNAWGAWGYWNAPLGALDTVCGGNKIKTGDVGAYRCLTVGESICRDNSPGSFGPGYWTLGIMDGTLKLFTPKNEVAWEACSDVTHLCIGEDHGYEKGSYSKQRPYLFFYDDKTHSYVGELTCDDTDGEGGSNIDKPSILKMVDVSDLGPYVDYNEGVGVTKYKKGQTEDPFDFNALFELVVFQDALAEAFYDSFKCEWTQICTNCRDEDYTDFDFTLEFDLATFCSQMPLPPETSALIESVLSKFLNQDAECDDRAEGIIGCVDEVYLNISLIDYENSNITCTADGEVAISGRRLQRRRRRSRRSRGRARGRGRCRRCRRRRRNSRKLIETSGIDDGEGGHWDQREYMYDDSSTEEAIQEQSPNRVLQQQAEDQQVTCPPDLAKLFRDEDDIFENVTEADVFNFIYLNCSLGTEDCNSLEGYCCDDGCTCSVPRSPAPSAAPSLSSAPSLSPVPSRSPEPSSEPSLSNQPSLSEARPSSNPSVEPSQRPSRNPSTEPSSQPSINSPPTTPPPVSSCVSNFEELNSTVFGAEKTVEAAEICPNITQIDICPGTSTIEFNGNVDFGRRCFALDSPHGQCTFELNGYSFVTFGRFTPITDFDVSFSSISFVNGSTVYRPQPTFGDDRQGGCIAARSKMSTSKVTTNNCTFSNCNAGASPSEGGAIFANQYVSLDLKSSIFESNSAQNGGAVGAFGTSSSINIIDCTFQDNESTDGGNGGGFFLNDGSFFITNSTFDNNTADIGGGIYIDSTNFFINQSTFKNNQASQGGAIFNAGSDGTIRECIFYDNTAVNSGNDIKDPFPLDTIVVCGGAGFGNAGNTFCNAVSQIGQGTVSTIDPETYCLFANTGNGPGCPSYVPNVPSEWNQIGQDIDGEASGDESGRSVSLSSDGTRVAVGAFENSDGGVSAGHVRVHEYNESFWNQVGQDIDGEASGDESGRSVSLSSDGTAVAIGAPENDDGGNKAGHVRVHKYNGTYWNQIGQDIDGEAPDDNSGWSVSLSSNGTVVAIGAPGLQLGSTGTVRVHGYNGTLWNQIGQDIDGEAPDDNSGWSVSLSSDGTRVAIGAPRNVDGGNLAGHVRVHEYNGTLWNQIGQDIDGEAEFDSSGSSVSLSSNGTVVAIGAPGIGSGITGTVRVHAYNGTYWNKIGQDIDGDAAGEKSGFSVSLSSDGTRVAIGAPFTTNGTVRVHEYNGTYWNQISPDIDGEAEDDVSGWSVSLSGDGTRVAIGAPDNGGNFAGHVRVFEE